MRDIWTGVDQYFSDLLLFEDQPLADALKANAEAGLPSIDVSPLQGKFLELMARISGAKRVLEVGTLGGYSAICFARAVGPGGRVLTLELDPRHVEIAKQNIERAGLLDRVEIRQGRAADLLKNLANEKPEPFDFVFIDADKAGNPDYLKYSLPLCRPGALILCDNVVRDGAVLNAQSADPNIQGIRIFAEMTAAEPRLSATALQTVGAKGYDGFILARVND